MFFLVCIYMFVFSAFAESSLTVYVAPIKVINSTPNVQATISDYSVIGYASTHWKSAKVKVDGSIKQIQDVYQNIYFYDLSTIKYSMPECNYKRDPKGCSYKNGHYLLLPIIEVHEYQVIVRMILYNQELQIAGTGIKTSKKIINYIKQQELTVIQEQSMMGSRTIIHKPKEELPLKWEIPYKLLDYHMHQASLGLWMGRIL